MTHNSEARKPVTLTIPESVREKAEYFLGEPITFDPRFWEHILVTGLEAMEREIEEQDRRYLEAEACREADGNDGRVIVDPPALIGSDHKDPPFDPDELPF